jgi:hypothetical protein
MKKIEGQKSRDTVSLSVIEVRQSEYKIGHHLSFKKQGIFDRIVYHFCHAITGP